MLNPRSARLQCMSYVYDNYVLRKSVPTLRAHCDIAFGIYGDEFEAILAAVQNQIRVVDFDLSLERSKAILVLMYAFIESVRRNDQKSSDGALHEIEKLLGTRLPVAPTASEGEIQAYKEAQKRGYVYLIQCGSTPNYKIGKTRSIVDRVRNFEVKLPFTIDLICAIKTPNRHNLETQLHRRFANKRVNGEWFALNASDIKHVKKLAADSGYVDNPMTIDF